MWMDRSWPTLAILFAQVGRGSGQDVRPASQWDIGLAFGALIAAMALGFWAIYRIKRWRENLAQDEPLTPQEHLDHYQQLVDDGLLDASEFARIKAQMEKPTHPAPSPPPPASQPPDTSFFEK